MTSIQAISQQLTPKNLLGLLTLLFFTVQPWDRHMADAFWLLLSLTSLCYIAIKKYQGQSLNTPKPLKTLLWLFTLMPLVSIISYLASPLDTLTPKLLEPDTRWLLIIPIILAMRDTQIGPKWVLAIISAYAVSTFISAAQETGYLTLLAARANGDENAVPYGMFNATIALMLLAYFISPYIKQNKEKPLLVRSLIFLAFILAALASFLSGTRAAVLLIPLTATLLYFSHYNFKKSAIGLILLLSTGTVFIATQTDSSFVKKLQSTPGNKLSYFKNNDRASKLKNPRLEQWKESWCIFKKHPLLGTGPRSFKYAHQVYGGKDHCNAVQQLKQGSYQAHSVYLNTLGTLGLTGILVLLLIFSILLSIAIKAFKHKNRTVKLGGSLLITAVFCHAANGITLDLWFMNHVMDKNLIVLALPLLLIYHRKTTTTA
jgi:O-antigen ligase